MDLDKNPRKLFSHFFLFFFYGKNVLSKQKRKKKKEKKEKSTLKSWKILDFKCRNDDANVKEALRYIGISRGDFRVESDGK